jgi:hypothetical protein
MLILSVAGTKNYEHGMASGGMMFTPNLMNIHKSVKKLGETYTDMLIA